MTLPAPLTPADCDLRDFDGFMLNVERLLASELWALSTAEEFKAAFGLWCRAWKQVPCASLPDDDAVLAAYSGAGKRWPKVKKMALRGFVKCFDGRLYHATLAEDAIRAAAKKKERKERTVAATKARLDKQRNVERDEPRHEKRNGSRDVVEKVDVTTSQGQYSTVQKKELQTHQPDSAREPASPLAALMSQVWKALNVNDASALPPNLSHRMREMVEGLLAENCDFHSDIAPALALRPEGQLWPQSTAYWLKIARANRDKRVAANTSKAGSTPVPFVELSEWQRRMRVWWDHTKWDRRAQPEGWGPAPGEAGCAVPEKLLDRWAA